ncbi:hypothetical protein MRB53_014630 [Persea americana]|uniref:Uncharacterized protein n=1 Tax=Persea americana TaxID=3435 RepID=A0ACC2KBC3_PERAE|nr:hypothetical protein MRB53_014630 [Persea americana]
MRKEGKDPSGGDNPDQGLVFGLKEQGLDDDLGILGYGMLQMDLSSCFLFMPIILKVWILLWNSGERSSINSRKIRALKRAAMATFSCPFHPTNYKRIQKTNVKALISCSFQPSQSNIKDFLLWGRGCDQWCSKGYWQGCNSGRNYSKRNGSSWCCGFCSCRTRCWKGLWYGGALEIPIISDLTMILGSISQWKAWASSSISLTVLLFMTMCDGLLLLQLEFLVVQRFVISIFTVGVFS